MTHPDAPLLIRIKAPTGRGDGDPTIRYRAMCTIRNDQLDDMILLRSDGTPVYMLAVVVDDHDMGVTHVIRGDDHLNNAARQMMIYNAMGWDVPVWAHIPLIHGPDGKKLSKRHGALGRRGIPGHGLPGAGHAQLSGASGLEPWRRRILSPTSRRWNGSIWMESAKARRGSIQKTGKLFAASTLRSPTTLHLRHEIEDFLAAAGLPALTASQA